MVLLLGGCSETKVTDELRVTVAPGVDQDSPWVLSLVDAKLKDPGDQITTDEAWSSLTFTTKLRGGEAWGDDATITTEAACETSSLVYRDGWTGRVGSADALSFKSHFNLLMNGMQAAPRRCALTVSLRRAEVIQRVEGCLVTSEKEPAGRFTPGPCDPPIQEGGEQPRTAGPVASPLLAWPEDGKGQGWAAFRVDFSRDGRPELPADTAPALDAACGREGDWSKRLPTLSVGAPYCTECPGWHPLTFGVDLAQHGLLKRSPPDACLLQLRPAKGAAPIHTWCWRSETGFSDGDADCERLVGASREGDEGMKKP